MHSVTFLPPTNEDCPRCLSVCLLARLGYSKTRAWIWMKFCVSTNVGTWTNWLTFEPDPDINPDAGTGKSESRRSVEVDQTGTSLRAGHEMHCREILFTPRCSPRAREIRGSGRLFCTKYGCGATGRQTCPIFGFWPLSGVGAPPSALLVLFYFIEISFQFWRYNRSYTHIHSIDGDSVHFTGATFSVHAHLAISQTASIYVS